MPLTLISLSLLGMAIVSFAILWSVRKFAHDGWTYLLASLAILFLTASLLVWAPAAYELLGGPSFMPTLAGKGEFDTQSYSGFLQILFGMPVAVAGSVYAILLARQSERQSRQFNDYEIEKNFRDRLGQRNQILGGFATALRDINNTSFILQAQVERAISVLPDSAEARELAVTRIQKEAAKMEEGLVMLRTALGNYRDASIAVREAHIRLDTTWRAPLDVLGWQFFKRPAGPPAPDARAPAENEAAVAQGASRQQPTKATELIDSFLARDYQAAADRFLVRAYQLSAEDVVRTRIERMVQSVVRWSEDEALRKDFGTIPKLLIGNGPATADIRGDSDYIGFRFIGAALLRADNVTDKRDLWKLPMRIDFGSALLLDSFQALPNVAQSRDDIRQWEEWKLLGRQMDDKQLERMLPDRASYFPQNFTSEVADIEAHYSYSLQEDTEEQERQVTRARLSYFALFHHMPPDWMDEAFDDLTARVLGDTPPLKNELTEHVACLAAGIQLARTNGARRAGMAALGRIVDSMGGAVERQFLQLGGEGRRNWRRCLLATWVRHPDPAAREAVRAQLEQQLASTTDPVLLVQLHLDLFDCHAALGGARLAAGHFEQARALLAGKSPDELAMTRWFAPSFLEHPAAWQNARIVLFGLWLSGYLMKQPWDLSFGGQSLSETEVAMPQGFLPAIWLGLARTGFIVLEHGRIGKLVESDEPNFHGGMIDPDQGDWHWDPVAVSSELDRLAREADAAGESIIDYLYERIS